MMLLRTSCQLHLLLPQTICHLSSLGRNGIIFCISPPPLNKYFFLKVLFWNFLAFFLIVWHFLKFYGIIFVYHLLWINL
jgi:hypothetical protein